jgi:hypothetical protein
VTPSDSKLAPVMAGHSRLKDGVASLAYVPAISLPTLDARLSGMPGTRPGMTASEYSPT